MALYQRLRDLREDADKTQAEVAAILGTTAQYYGRYEKGESEIPFSRAIELAKYYNVSLDYIAGHINMKNLSLNEDEMKLIKQYRDLTERNKGKADLLLSQLIRSQQKGK